MKAMMLLTGGGCLVIPTSYASATDSGLLAELHEKGIDKFVAHEIPVELVRERYGRHFDVVAHDWHETDRLRVLDYLGDRAFKLFHFDEMGPVVEYDSEGHDMHEHGDPELRKSAANE